MPRTVCFKNNSRLSELRANAAQYEFSLQGYIWGDGTLGCRMALGQSFVFKPFAQLQYTKILDQNGVTSSEEFFWGGGINMALIFGRNMALVFEYSYVDFFIGMDVSRGDYGR